MINVDISIFNFFKNNNNTYILFTSCAQLRYTIEFIYSSHMFQLLVIIIKIILILHYLFCCYFQFQDFFIKMLNFNVDNKRVKNTCLETHCFPGFSNFMKSVSRFVVIISRLSQAICCNFRNESHVNV